MQYYVRVAIGFVLGAALAAGFALFTGKWVAAGAMGAGVGVAGFLATFFVWSADRLPEYEQVLFDGRNNLHALGLAALLVGVAFGSVNLYKPDAPVDPVLLQMDADHDALTHLYNEIQAAKLDDAGVADARKTVADVQGHLPDFPEGDHANFLTTAAKAIASALDKYEECGYESCQAANLALLDAKRPLNDYAA